MSDFLLPKELVDKALQVVEANPAWASGLCGVEPTAVLEVLRGCVVADAAGEAARWLRPRADASR